MGRSPLVSLALVATACLALGAGAALAQEDQAEQTTPEKKPAEQATPKKETKAEAQEKKMPEKKEVAVIETNRGTIVFEFQSEDHEPGAPA